METIKNDGTAQSKLVLDVPDTAALRMAADRIDLLESQGGALPGQDIYLPLSNSVWIRHEVKPKAIASNYTAEVRIEPVGLMTKMSSVIAPAPIDIGFPDAL